MIKRYNALIMIGATLLLALITLTVSIFSAGKNDQGIFDPVNFTDPTHTVASSPISAPHGQISLEYIIHMNDILYDRFPFTFKEMDTAVWLVEELLSMGYTQNDIKVQEYTFGSIQSLYDMGFLMELFFFIDRTPFVNIGTRPSLQSQNVILTVPGQSDEVIVIGAHYDSVFLPGASDNASGVALLLESAKRMREFDNYYTLEYVFFGAEEMGLFGAFYYVDDLSSEEHQKILFMINADILLDGDELFYMAGYSDGGYPGANHITETWDLIADDANSRHDLDLIPLPWGVFAPSDQLAFLPFGHTAMFLAGLDAEVIPQGDISQAIYGMSRVMHSSRDDIHYINKTWPDKAERNMRTFSIFLEKVLTAEYTAD